MSKLGFAFVRVFLSLIAALFILGCKGGETSASLGGPTSPAVDGPVGSNDGTASETDFYVGVDSSINAVANVHSATSFTTNCFIPANSATSKDIECIVDTPEADLYTSGLSLKYNVPAKMCHYISKQPYWYYNYEVGRGPTSMSIYRVISSDGSSVMSYTTSVDGSAPVAASTYPEVNITVDGANNEYKCIYNQAGSGGQDCCIGNAALTVRTIRYALTGSSTDTTESSTYKWPGSISSCIGGAGSKNNGWPAFSDGFPAEKIEPSRGGVAGRMTFEAAVSKGHENNRYLANYYKPATHTHTGFGPVMVPPIATRTSDMPYFIDPIDDRNGTKIPRLVGDGDTSNTLKTAHEAYEFKCLDEAFEVQHRIRIYVREWDTYKDYAAYVTSNGDPAKLLPDRGSDVEGIGCSGLSGPCNDFIDIDDFLTLELGGPYDVTAPSILLRDKYFPKDK